MRSATIILIAFALIAMAFAADEAVAEEFSTECPENQEWTFCAASCEPQCNNFSGKKCGAIMTLQCEPQCVCKAGHLRIAGNKCIPEDSAECNGLYDPLDAFKKHKYTGVLQANES